MRKKIQIMASLADLNQQFAGSIPVAIVKRWMTEPKTEDLERSILAPFYREGFLVCSDSAGLSKLSHQKSLIDVMKIVSLPKEIIFAHGRAIGGKGVGVWAADNTQMFYDQTVKAEDLIQQMAGAQKEIALQAELQVGMGIQYGSFLEISQGFFGSEVNQIEYLTENHTKAGELVVLESVRRLLGEKYLDFLERTLEKEVEWPVYRVNYSGIALATKESMEWQYPIPFSVDFFEYIRANQILDDNNHLVRKYLSNKVVVLVKVTSPERVFFLDHLTDWVVMQNMLAEIAQEFEVKTVKSNGVLGIFVSDDPVEAVDFAEKVLEALGESGDPVSIGVAGGEVLIFDLEPGLGGGLEIAGNPVNIASKIAEDIDERDSLYIHDSVRLEGKNLSHYLPFSIVKSGVKIEGIKHSS